MDFDDLPMQQFPDLALALLRASGGGLATADTAARSFRHDLIRANVSPLPDLKDLAVALDSVRRHLAAAHLVEMLDDRRFRITPRGRATMHTHPDGIDASVLMKDFPEYRAWMARISAHAPPEDVRAREFQHGWAAQRDGKGLTDNPYPPDTAQYTAWEDGWSEGRRGK
jgi:hypothetical protein